MIKHIIYIHGFNSDGDGWKADALRKHFPNKEVIAPDFPAAPKQVMEQLKALLATRKPEECLLIGTSLGGFYAYIISAQYAIPAWLFNPSLAPYQTLDDRGIGQFYTWKKQRPYLFKKVYLTQLADLKNSSDKQIKHELLQFYIATDDDILDHSTLAQQFPSNSIHYYDKAGHSFSKFEKVLKQNKNNLAF